MEKLVINDVTPRVQYEANGETTKFSFTFAVFDASDLQVWLNEQLQDTGYGVSLSDMQGGSVTFMTPPTSGTTVTLVRNMAYNQEADFTQSGYLRRDVLQDEFSRVFAMIQQLAENVSRSVTVSVWSDVDPREIISQVEYLYADKENIDAVASVVPDIGTIADNIDDVKTTAENIAAILDAPNQAAASSVSATAAAGSATAAAESAATAEQWAIGQPTEPAEFSAKAWAGQSKTNADNGLAAINARIADFEANGEAVISTDMRYFNVVTASEYAALPAEKKTAAYFYIVIPG